jgi:hypothetical protein
VAGPSPEDPALTKSNKRRLLAHLLPIPVIVGVALILRGLGLFEWLAVLNSIPYALATVCSWAIDRLRGRTLILGLDRATLAASITVAFWYFVLAVISQAVLCPRLRVSRAIATAGAAALLLAVVVSWS